jgi:epsilon-lactone hydrolase
MSFRLRLLNAGLRWVARPRLSRIPDPVSARRDLDRMAPIFFPVPRLVQGSAVSLPGPQGAAIPALWIEAGRTDPRFVVLYLHGGGYIAGEPQHYRAMLGLLSRLSGLRFLVPAYRLAPETPFPAALQDARAAWDALLAMGFAPGQIALGGDSAGGGLCLALLAQLCAERQAPRLAFAFSPWTDLTGSGASIRTNASRDPVLPAQRFGELVAHYLAGHHATDPRASPLFADFPAAPPIYLQVSDSEILRDDTDRLAARLTGMGAEVCVDRWPDAPHGWQLFAGRLPEARDALTRTATQLRRAFTPLTSMPADS